MTNKKTRDEEVAHARRYMAMPLTKAAMDRARGHWVPWLIEALDEAEAEQVRMRDVLLRNNFAPCDTQACNCGGWHERATGDGFYARFREIEEAIGDHNGKTLLAAVVEMVQERDSLQTEVDGTIQSRAESLAWDALGRPEGTHDTSNVQRLCEAHGALKAKLDQTRDWYADRWARLRAFLAKGSAMEKGACDIMANGHLLADQDRKSAVALATERAEAAEAELAALVKASQPFANDQGCDAVHHGLADRHDQRDTCPVVARLREALAAAKVQP